MSGHLDLGMEKAKSDFGYELPLRFGVGTADSLTKTFSDYMGSPKITG